MWLNDNEPRIVNEMPARSLYSMALIVASRPRGKTKWRKMKKGTSVDCAECKDDKQSLRIIVHRAKIRAESLSRFGILACVKDSLHIPFRKIEQLCSGAAYCQLMNMLFSGCVNLREDEFQTNLEYEYIQNLKLLQASFQKVGVDKDIPVDRLIKGLFQDNPQFAQLFKQFFDANYNGKVYNPVEVRRETPVGGTCPGPSRITNNRHLASRPLHATKSVTRNAPVSKPLGAATRIPDDTGADDSHKLEDLMIQVTDLKSTVDDLKKERDLYHGKLRDIEAVCRGWEEKNAKADVVRQILKVLYATREGFS